MQTPRIHCSKSAARFVAMAGLVLTLTTSPAANAGGNDSGGSSGGGDPWENELVADETLTTSDETSATAEDLTSLSGLDEALIVILQLLVAR